MRDKLKGRSEVRRCRKHAHHRRRSRRVRRRLVLPAPSNTTPVVVLRFLKRIAKEAIERIQADFRRAIEGVWPASSCPSDAWHRIKPPATEGGRLYGSLRNPAKDQSGRTDFPRSPRQAPSSGQHPVPAPPARGLQATGASGAISRNLASFIQHDVTPAPARGSRINNLILRRKDRYQKPHTDTASRLTSSFTTRDRLPVIRPFPESR